MAKSLSISIKSYRKRVKKRRPGVHSKKKSSKNKNSKHYKKSYNRQGK